MIPEKLAFVRYISYRCKRYTRDVIFRGTILGGEAGAEIGQIAIFHLTLKLLQI